MITIYTKGDEVPHNISCVYYAVSYSLERGEHDYLGFLVKIGMSSNPFNRNKTLKYTHIIHCFDLTPYKLTSEKQREFVEKYIQAKIEKFEIGKPDPQGGDHFYLPDLYSHEYILRNFDDWAKQAIVAYHRI